MATDGTPIHWHGSSHNDIRGLPPEARQLLGFQLRRLQLGLNPDDWKPMKSIGPGVREIRVSADSEYRLIYLTGIETDIRVFHVFEKRSQRTSRPDVELARKRYQAFKRRRT